MRCCLVVLLLRAATRAQPPAAIAPARLHGPPKKPGGVAVIASTDCRSASPLTFREFGTQLSASLVQLMRMKEIFPDWDAFLVTRRERWNKGKGDQPPPSCEAAWTDLGGLYRERFGADVRLVHFSVAHFRLLKALEKVPGGEGDHSRGHWPLEASPPARVPERKKTRTEKKKN